MEIAALAAFLAPFLGRLLKPAQDAAGDAVERLGDKAWEHAEEIWGRLSGKVDEKPAARDVAEDVADNPEDEEARGALAYQLRKLLNDNPELAAEVEQMWERARQEPQVGNVVTVYGARAVGVGGDNSGSITIGDSRAPERRL